MMKHLLAALLLAAAAPLAARTVVIYHTSDVHGRYLAGPDGIGGFPALAALVKKETSPVLLLDSGDWFTGTPEGGLSGGLASVELMNALGYSAAVLGNHEYDLGEDALRTALSSATFKVLGANIRLAGGGPAPYAAPYVILNAGGEKIAVLGLSNPRTPELTAGDTSGLAFEDEKKALLRVLPEAAKEKPDAVVLLAHDGISAGDYIDGASWTPRAGDFRRGTLALARAAGGRVNLILGGHIHTLLGSGYTDKKTGTVIGESGWGLTHASRAVLTFDDKTGKLLGVTDRAVKLDAGAGGGDPAVLKEARGISASVAARLGERLGEAAEDIPRAPAPGPAVESPLGSLLCDLVREAAGTQAAIQNTEGLRADLRKGPVTFARIYSVTPFNTRLVTMSLTGRQLKALLKAGLSGDGTALQVSGLEVEYAAGYSGKAKDLSIKIGGAEVKPDQYYSVALNDFFLRSPRWRELAAGRGRKNGGALLRDIIAAGIKKAAGPLRRPAPGRIKRRA